MALPWLIGAAVVALGAAAVSALNNDDDPDDNEEEERRLKEKVEKERKLRAHNEKITRLKEEFSQHGIQQGDDLKRYLEGKIKVTLHGEKAFKATLDESESPYPPVGKTCIEHYSLQFLDQETQGCLIEFESLYDLELEPEKDLMKASVKLEELDQKLFQLKELRQRLEY